MTLPACRQNCFRTTNNWLKSSVDSGWPRSIFFAEWNSKTGTMQTVFASNWWTSVDSSDAVRTAAVITKPFTNHRANFDANFGADNNRRLVRRFPPT
jgi:hypothetical protein